MQAHEHYKEVAPEEYQECTTSLEEIQEDIRFSRNVFEIARDRFLRRKRKEEGIQEATADLENDIEALKDELAIEIEESTDDHARTCGGRQLGD